METKFKRIVKHNKNSLKSAVIGLVGSLVIFVPNPTPFIFFISGANFMGFIFNLIDYHKSREVYYKEIKKSSPKNSKANKK